MRMGHPGSQTLPREHCVGECNYGRVLLRVHANSLIQEEETLTNWYTDVTPYHISKCCLQIKWKSIICVN